MRSALSFPPASPVPPEESQASSVRESVWGTVVLTAMIVCLLLAAGWIAFLGYARWRMAKAAASRVSIAVLPSVPVSTPSETSDGTGSLVSPAPPALIDTKALQVSVINGGGARGSAGTLGKLIQQAGYVKVTVGNAQRDYTGTTVLYTPELEREAKRLFVTVQAPFPKATLAPFDAQTKEASFSPLTVVLGK